MSYTKSSIRLRVKTEYNSSILQELHVSYPTKKKKKSQTHKNELYSTSPPFLKWQATEFTLNNAITTEKKLMNAVAKISGLEKTTGLLYTWVWKWWHALVLKHRSTSDNVQKMIQFYQFFCKLTHTCQTPFFGPDIYVRELKFITLWCCFE